MLGCFVFSCMHAYFGPRHERDFTPHTNRASANRWGEDDSPCMWCAKAIVPYLLAWAFWSTINLLVALLSCQVTWCHTALVISFIDYRNNEHKLRQRLRFSIAESACIWCRRNDPNLENKRKCLISHENRETFFTSTSTALTVIISRVS